MTAREIPKQRPVTPGSITMAEMLYSRITTQAERDDEVPGSGATAHRVTSPAEVRPSSRRSDAAIKPDYADARRDIVEASSTLDPESRADERGDRVAGHCSHGRDRDRADGRAAARRRPSEVRYEGLSVKLTWVLPRTVRRAPPSRRPWRSRSRPCVYSAVFASPDWIQRNGRRVRVAAPRRRACRPRSTPTLKRRSAAMT